MVLIFVFIITNEIALEYLGRVVYRKIQYSVLEQLFRGIPINFEVQDGVQSQFLLTNAEALTCILGMC